MRSTATHTRRAGCFNLGIATIDRVGPAWGQAVTRTRLGDQLVTGRREELTTLATKAPKIATFFAGAKSPSTNEGAIDSTAFTAANSLFRPAAVRPPAVGVKVSQRGGLARPGGMPSYRVQPRMFSRCTQMPEAAEPAAATPAIIAATIIATRIEYSIRELPALWCQRRRSMPTISAPKGSPQFESSPRTWPAPSGAGLPRH